MADASVLREYLVALGFRVNETEAKKFDNRLAAWDKRANVLGKALAGAGVAAVAMVSQFSIAMEKLYFASKRTDSAVGSIQALEYGASRVGVGSDKIRGSLEAMARNLRANPGLTGLLNSLGVRVEGRDKADVLTDLVGQLQKMPFYVAEKYANLFGIDPDTLFMLQEGLAEFKKAQAERKQWASDLGVDSDKAAKAAHELANQWREVAERAGIFKDALLIEALPALLEISKVTKEVLADWTRLVQQGDLWGRFLEGAGLKDTGGGVKLSRQSLERTGQSDDPDAGKSWLRRKYEGAMRAMGAKGYQRPEGTAGRADEASVDAAQDTEAFKRGGTGPRRSLSYVPNGRGGYVYQPQAANDDQGPAKGAAELFERLERKYSLTPGTLDRLWKTESGRGENLTGPMTKYGRAKGHFQFIDSTAQDYGMDLDGGRADRDNLEKSAKAAARYFSDLKAKYGGDDRKAAAAYNWGPGNVDRLGLGAAPRETREYIEKVAPSASITQTNNVNVYGATSPEQTGQVVREEMRSSNADVVRNFRAKVQ